MTDEFYFEVFKLVCEIALIVVAFVAASLVIVFTIDRAAGTAWALPIAVLVVAFVFLLDRLDVRLNRVPQNGRRA